MNKIFGGVDPGKSGIVAIINDGEVVWYPIPVLGTDYDNKGLSTMINTINQATKDNGVGIHFVLENVNAIASWGAVQNWSLGACKEMFKQVFTDFQIPFTPVHSKTWQKEMWSGVKPNYLPLTAVQKTKGRTKGSVDTKTTSLIAAQRLFPKVDFYVTSKGNKSKNFNDNLVDAVLMAEYCRRNFK